MARYLTAIRQLARGDLDVELAPGGESGWGPLAAAVNELAAALRQQESERRKFDQLVDDINQGLTLDEVLDRVYRGFRTLIPYDRIGCALFDETGRNLVARWAQMEYSPAHLVVGYRAPLAGSSLGQVLRIGEPRILNDLQAYLAEHPDSDSTKRAVGEGVRSSLTCPLIAEGKPLGFLFFSSRQPGTYAGAHVAVYQRLAQKISLIVQRSRLGSQLEAQRAELKRQNEELLQLSDLKNRFLGMVTHDLRSPVANVQSVAELLLEDRNGLDEAEKRAFLNDILQQARYMLPLLEDLLDVTRIEASQLKLQRQMIGVASALQDAVTRHRRLAEPKRTRITLQAPAEGEVYADPIRLRQVLDNLISNALKFSPPGSTIRVQAKPEPAGWYISIQDQGPGLTAEDRGRLFQAFARLSAKPTGDEKSTGLGLAITRRVIEAHGGQIGADSVPGAGATFWFRLPSRRVSDTEGQAAKAA